MFICGSALATGIAPAKLLQEESFASAGYPYFNRGKKIGVKPYCDEGRGKSTIKINTILQYLYHHGVHVVEPYR